MLRRGKEGMVNGRNRGRGRNDRRAKRRRRIACVLGASLFGGAMLALFAGRGDRPEHSSIPLSGAPPPAKTVFQSSKPRPQPVKTVVQGVISTDRVNVYVYDGVPELDFSGLIQCYRDRHDGVPPWQDERADMAQDMGEIWLHRAILSHPWRVLDPEQADLFYVPMYPVLSFKVELGGVHPFNNSDATTRIQENRCEGLTHTARMDAAVQYLSRSSPFFNRYGGADHVLVCAWWFCRGAVNSSHRMLLRRTVIGINEINFGWFRWGCGPGRAVTVPYTASSVLTTNSMIGGRPAEERDIPFFFVGTARNRPERMNLDVVKNISDDSVVLLGGRQNEWGMNSTVYAEHIVRSRFCFCPRGDTPSSRRIFDAVAAGCIPIITEGGAEVLPYLGTGLNYAEFAVVVDREAFSTREGVTNVTLGVLEMSDERLDELRGGRTAGESSLVYGLTTGTGIGDMNPFQGTATKFLQEAYALAGGAAAAVRGGGEQGEAKDKKGMWECPPTAQPKVKLALRTESKLPPVSWERRQWLSDSETIVNKERSLMFCAPPNTGSLQFRMLAKRMQGVSHWAVADDWSLLFDPADSELELLDVTDGALMTKIYSENGSGWIKIAVVRDPVTRLLSAYLDVVRSWQAGLQRRQEESSNHDRKRQLQQADESEDSGRNTGPGKTELSPGGTGSEWWLLDAILENRRQRQQRGQSTTRVENDVATSTARSYHRRKASSAEQGAVEKRSPPALDSFVDSRGWDGWDAETDPSARRLTVESKALDEAVRTAADAGKVLMSDTEVHIPTLAEVVDALKVKRWKAPAAFRESASLCGMQHSPFDSIIPFERLQNTSTEVLKSLPGGIWESFGASGWGADGKHAFMEFDYGGAAWRKNVGVQVEVEQAERRDKEDPLPRRASDLFEGESCAWADFYGDMATLESVGKLYALDYSQFRWYKLAPWRERLKRCIDGKNR